MGIRKTSTLRRQSIVLGPEIANIALKDIFDLNGLDPDLFGAYDRKGYD